MTPEAYGQVGATIKEQYRFFDRFLADIDRGLKLDGRFAARAASYTDAGLTTAHKAQRQVQRALGMRFERNIEDPSIPEAAHCQGVGSCPEQTALGWVPLGTLIPLGQRVCLGNDRCTILFSADAGG